MGLLDVFFSGILPVFAVPLIGYLAGRSGALDAAAAGAVNKVVFLLALPAMLFRLIAGAPIDAFPWPLAFGYLAVEVVIVAAAALIAATVFRRGLAESLLLGMTAGFGNNVLIVLPITLALFDEAAARTVVAIILVDSVLVFSGFIVLMDIVTSEAPSGVGRRLWGALTRNPPVLAMLAGLAAALIEAPIPEGLAFFLRFLGDAGPPGALIALGLVLATRKDRPEYAAPIAISLLKLAAFPALIWWMSRYVTLAPDGQELILLLAATAPCGAMPLVLALQFRTQPSTIAQAVLISTTASAFVLAAIIGFAPAS